MAFVIEGRAVVPGVVRAPVLACGEPLSFWGGYDQATGEIIDRRHPLSGEQGAGRVIAVPHTRGSSTTTGILLESVRAGVAPAALVTVETDPFLALASIVAGEMYGSSFPVVAVDAASFRSLRSGQIVSIETDGRITVEDA